MIMKIINMVIKAIKIYLILNTVDQVARKGGREVDGELAELDPSNDKSGGQVRL